VEQSERNFGYFKKAYGAFPPETPVGMAYVPVQTLSAIYEPAYALKQGTIFPDLDKPFLGSAGMFKKEPDSREMRVKTVMLDGIEFPEIGNYKGGIFDE